MVAHSMVIRHAILMNLIGVFGAVNGAKNSNEVIVGLALRGTFS